MESTHFGPQPGVEAVLDLPAVIGVRAIRFAVAGVAGMRGCLIQHDLAFVIRFFALEVLPGGTFPRVDLRMIGKSGDVELFRITLGKGMCAN